jgi:nucleoid-associated protein YgaU
MRKDVILGMTLGGLMLAIVIGYLVISPNSKQDKHQLETAVADGSGGGAEGSGAEGTESEVKPASADPDRLKDELAEYKPTKLTATAKERNDHVWGGLLFGGAATTSTPDVLGGPSGSEPVTGDISTNDNKSGAAETGTVSPTTQRLASRDIMQSHSGTSHAMHTHKVQQGETFTTIAKSAYGNGNLFNVIVRANPKIDPSRLKIGTEINLPDISEVKGPAKVAENDAEKVTPAGTAVLRVDMVKIDPKTEYRVAAGDSLHKISMKVFGNISMVDKLYEMNKTVIGSDPAKLKLGTVLKLPSSAVVSN